MEFMEEVIFLGVDIVEGVKDLLKSETKDICNEMTDNEKQAYNLGVETTLSALSAGLDNQLDGYVYTHIPGKSVCEEMDYAELSKIVL